MIPFDLPPKSAIWMPPKPAIIRAVSLKDASLAMPLLSTFAAASARGLRSPNSGIAADNIDAIPDMTSGTTSGVTITTTNSNAGFPAWHAADDDNGTSYLTQTAAASIWKVDFGAGNEKIIQSYTMTEIHAGEYVSGVRCPQAWTFQASTDDFTSSTVTLDTQSGQTTVAANNKRTFSVVNQTAYRYYRLNISAVSGQLHGFAEAEFRT